MDKVWIGLVGVLLGGMLALAKDFLKILMARQEQAEYLAIRVVCAFDRYVEGCADVAGDDGLSCGQLNSEGVRQIQVSEPELDLKSFDVDWKSLPSNLMYDILSFPNDIEEAKHIIHSAFEYAACPPDYEEGFEERQYQYAILGLRAKKLSDALRKKYKLPDRKYGNWNPIEYLNEIRDQVLKSRDDRSG